MPKGKGTYGSKVGRPPKAKKMAQGGMVSGFFNPPPAADPGIGRRMGHVGDRDWFDNPEKGGGAYHLGGEVMPSSNALNRNVVDFAGSGNTGYNTIGRYQKGGEAKNSSKEKKKKK